MKDREDGVFGLRSSVCPSANVRWISSLSGGAEVTNCRICVCEAGMGPCGDSCCENRSVETTAAATSGRKRAEGRGVVIAGGGKGALVCVCV